MKKKQLANKKHPDRPTAGVPGDHGPINRWAIAVIVLFTFLLYFNTLTNDYALDDGTVITQNQFTQQGWKGIGKIFSYHTLAGAHGQNADWVAGGRYRPLSVATFALEWQFFGKNPGMSHFINVLLYALTGVLLFLLLRLILRDEKLYFTEWYWTLPFLTTLVFIAHPTHTEVVANIKSRDEILGLLGLLGASYLTFKYVDVKKAKYLGYAAIILFFALLAKENAIVCVVLTPLGLYLFRHEKIKSLLTVTSVLTISALVYLLIRQSVVGQAAGATDELMNNPFLYATTAQRYATVFYTMWRYILLLFFPHPLTWDYYPYHVPLLEWHDLRVIFSFLLFSGVIAFTLWQLYRKKAIVAYSLSWYLISLSIVSNFFFQIGVFMSERFLYTPSLGFALLVVFIVFEKIPAYWAKSNRISISTIKKYCILFLLLLLSAYAIRVITRNKVWQNNYTLFTHDVAISSNSARSLCTAGEQYLLRAIAEKDSTKQKAWYRLAKPLLLKAVTIHPRYTFALNDLGIVYMQYDKKPDSALHCFMQNARREPGDPSAFKNMAILFDHFPDPDLKFKTYLDLYSLTPNRYDIHSELGVMYLNVQLDIDKAEFHLKKALAIKPGQFSELVNLGVLYDRKNDLTQALKYFKEAEKIKPNDRDNLHNLAVIYYKMGDKITSAVYFQKEKEMKINLN